MDAQIKLLIAGTIVTFMAGAMTATKRYGLAVIFGLEAIELFMMALALR